MLESKELRLRELTEEDLIIRVKMCNDKEIQKLMSGQIFENEVTVEDMKKWFTSRKAEKRSMQFAIEYNGQYIGDIDINNINYDTNSLNIIPMIGLKEYWGKGLGTKAIEIVKSYAKKSLNIKSIYLEVFPFNIRAITSYKKLGFVQVGQNDDGEIIMRVDF